MCRAPRPRSRTAQSHALNGCGRVGPWLVVGHFVVTFGGSHRAPAWATHSCHALCLCACVIIGCAGCGTRLGSHAQVGTCPVPVPRPGARARAGASNVSRSARIRERSGVERRSTHERRGRFSAGRSRPRDAKPLMETNVTSSRQVPCTTAPCSTSSLRHGAAPAVAGRALAAQSFALVTCTVWSPGADVPETSRVVAGHSAHRGRQSHFCDWSVIGALVRMLVIGYSLY